ncbi:MAG: hypothetical protein JSW27_21610 [Phycisphaerales bacterium]|nr:MAG: hypothetical protein JSW27_21610 [Phycisphaerales bacterium]
MRHADEIKELFDGAEVTIESAEDETVFETIKTAYTRNVQDQVAQQGSPLGRFTMKSPVTRLAVAAALLIAVGIGVQEIGGGRPAFADIVRPFLEAQTATFTIVMHLPDRPAATMQGQFLAPGRERRVGDMGAGLDEDAITITDYVKGKALVLLPSQRAAVAVELTDRPDDLDPKKLNQFEELRRRIERAQVNPDEMVEYLGESQIEGSAAIGYRFTEFGAETTIWADAETLLPLQVEHAIVGSGAKVGSIVMMDIQFNVPLDPAAFSMEVPEDYTLQTMSFDGSTPREDDLVRTLRTWTQITGGRFPSAIDALPSEELEAAFGQDESLKTEDLEDLGDPAVQERMQVFVQLMRGFLFVQSLSAEGLDWHYAGADATFGDATTPVFWYRPAGSATYRVIYADLSVLDATAEELTLLEEGSDRQEVAR